MFRSAITRACTSCTQHNHLRFLQQPSHVFSSSSSTTTPFQPLNNHFSAIVRSISINRTLYKNNINNNNNNNTTVIGGEESHLEEEEAEVEAVVAEETVVELIEAEFEESSFEESEDTTILNRSKQQMKVQQKQFERPQLFAVIQTGGKQYRVAPGDMIAIDKIPVNVDTQVKFQKVLLVGGSDFTAVGRPIIPQTFVTGTVCEQKRAAHVIVFKKKRRKGYRRTRGHRQLVSVVRIDDIELSESVNEQNGVEQRVVAVE